MPVRRIQRSDIDAVVGLVHQLALYEQAADRCRLTSSQLEAALFGERPALFGHVAEMGSEVAGMALWFLNFSTWDGVHGIYLEDLYVQPRHRRSGVGRQLVAALAEECLHRGFSRLEWSVLDWNEPAIGFYRSLGAVPRQEWTSFRLEDPALPALASGPS